MKLIWSTSETLVGALTMAIYVATLPLASKVGVEAMVATTLLPGISQVYWIATVRAETGLLPQPLTFLCEIWLVLFAILIYARHHTLRAATARPA